MANEASIDQLFLNKVNEAIESNLADENFGVDELALETGISRSQLHRRLNSLTGKSASQTIKEFRLKKALEMLQNNVGNASEISYKVGFKNPSHFNASFKIYFGYPPGKAKHIGFLKKGDKPVTSKRWKIASYISFVVIVGLIVLNVIPLTGKKEILDKSIAVLPFISDSPDDEDEYIINGYMSSVHNNLCRIRALKVLSLQSTEQYKDNPKPVNEIFSELNVTYLLSARGQMYNNLMRLIVQLIDKDGDIIWSNAYDKQIIMVDDHIGIQSDISQLVAGQIEAIITPEEKELMEKVPTASLNAWDFYQRGKVEYWKYTIDFESQEALEKAKAQYDKALDYDSTFALAYTGMANVYWDMHYRETYFSENFLDSVLILADKAISCDNQLAEAYTVRGDYYRETGQTEDAIKEYDKAITFNPNSWMAYRGKGTLFLGVDNLKALENYHKAASLNRGGPEFPSLLEHLIESYYTTGFHDKAKHYAQEVMMLTGDSSGYYHFSSREAYNNGEFTKSIEYLKKALAIDSSLTGAQWMLAWVYSGIGQYENALKYLQKLNESQVTSKDIRIGDLHRLGYAYWQNGYTEKADYYFDKQIDYCTRTNELGRHYSNQFKSYYDLAGVYAFRGDKEKAFDHLRIFNKQQNISFSLLNLFRNDPLFDSIRGEPEFEQIFSDIESKYQAEHERVRQWLEENDLL